MDRRGVPRPRPSIRDLLNAAKADAVIGPAGDWQKLGLAGHSLGGYTALAMAGARTAWRLANVQAVLAMAPYSKPYLVSADPPRLDAPVIIQAGEFDALLGDALSRPADCSTGCPRRNI